MSKGKVIAGFAFGAAVGSALGALYAPDKGEKTRRKLAKKGSAYAGEIKDRFHHIVDDLIERMENTTEKVKTKVQSARDTANEIREDATRHARSAAKDIRDDAKDFRGENGRTSIKSEAKSSPRVSNNATSRVVKAKDSKGRAKAKSSSRSVSAKSTSAKSTSARKK